MSIANLSSSSLYGIQDVNANTIRAETIDANVVGIQDLTCQNVTATSGTFGSLDLTQSPALNLSNSNVLVYNSVNGNVEYNNSIGAGAVTDGQNLGTVQVYKGKSGSILQFYGLNADIAQGFNITIPFASNDVVIENSFLNQDVKTSAAPSFLGPLHLGGLTQDGAITLSTTSLSTSTIRCGTVSQIPFEVVGASGYVTSLNDSGFNDTFITAFGTQDMINKNLNAELTSFYSNTGLNRKLLFNFTLTTVNNTSTTLRFQQTVDRTITFPNNSGTVALLTDIPTNANYVDLTTNQTVGGTKTFTSAPIISSISNGGGTLTVPSGVSSTFATIDSVQTLSNKTISNLTSSGTTDSMLGAKTLRYYWTVNTTNNSSTTAITIVNIIPINTAATIRTTCQAYCTSGAQLDKVGSRIIQSAAKNVAGTYSVVGNTTIFSQNDSGLNALSINHSISGSNVLVQVSGLNSNNFTWSGVTELYLQ